MKRNAPHPSLAGTGNTAGRARNLCRVESLARSVMTDAPLRQVCPVCAFDDDITLFRGGGGSTRTYKFAGEADSNPYTWTGHLEESLEGRRDAQSDRS
jgi:hypothetical protein